MKPVATEFVDLEKFALELRTLLNEKYLMDTEVSIERSYMEFAMRTVCLQVKGFVWAEDKGRQEIRYPKDWIEAFKARWFPKWALKRWPVKMQVDVVDMKVIFPDYRPLVDGARFRMFAMRQPSYFVEEDAAAS